MPSWRADLSLLPPLRSRVVREEEGRGVERGGGGGGGGGGCGSGNDGKVFDVDDSVGRFEQRGFESAGKLARVAGPIVLKDA